MAQRFRILVADRNPNVRELLQRELGRDGFEVEVAGSGEAVNSMIYGHTPPDLLILDLDLPYAGEVALLERIRARRPQIPIIIHSFLAENSEREADGGTRTYIEKNGNMDILKDAVRGMLARFYPDRFLALSDADADRGSSRKRTGEAG